MEPTYWIKQDDKPVFEDLVWSRPESRQARGKLLIVGGSRHGFAAPATAYQAASAAGAGSTRVLLPDAVKKIVGAFLEHAEYGASTPSGSFAGQAYGELVLQAAWADGILLAGDFGRNTETTVLLEKFLTRYDGQLTITQDAVDCLAATPRVLVDRTGTTIVCDLAQLQKLARSLGLSRAVTFGMGLVQLVELLHEITKRHPGNIIVRHLDHMVVAAGGLVSTTRQAEAGGGDWRVSAAANAAVWWLQNPTKTFAALTTAAYAGDNT
jgi:hypothetical protein